MRMPRGIFAPMSEYLSPSFKKVTMSRSSCKFSSMPATSVKRREGITPSTNSFFFIGPLETSRKAIKVRTPINPKLITVLAALPAWTEALFTISNCTAESCSPVRPRNESCSSRDWLVSRMAFSVLPPL